MHSPVMYHYMSISVNVCMKSTDRHILIKDHNFHDYVDICIICSRFTNSLTRFINVRHTHFITQMMQLISQYWLINAQTQQATPFDKRP